MVIVVGRKERLGSDEVIALLPEAARDAWPVMLEGLSPADKGAATSTWLAPGGPVKRVVAAALPEACSRHNSPARPHAIADLVKRSRSKKDDVGVILALDEADHAIAAVSAVARAFPEYSRKTRPNGGERTVTVGFVPGEGEVTDIDGLERVARAVRHAARLVDMPTSELNTVAFVAEARAAAERVGADVKVIEGEAVQEAGLGCLWAVGKAASDGPALVVLTHSPDGADDSEDSVAWVGKGIVYDTGGLSLKTKAGMPGMKGDMGGAAAVLCAFEAAVAAGGIGKTLHAILCLAENAVGPDSLRPDDVITGFSGRTVEVNNTDAEGRLVLADGVAWAAKELKAKVIVDLATLTGAQLMATGRKHAAVVTNDADLEAAAVIAGRKTGDLVHPLPYVPEFYRAEFKSDVADMKNSVKDRMNAQTSCAAQFIAEHLRDLHEGSWVHFDIAGPSGLLGRGTGYGVALLLEVFAAPSGE